MVGAGLAAARLVVTRLDQTGAVLPGAVVTLSRPEGPGERTLLTATATRTGTVAFEGLEPSRYTVQVAFAGFQTLVLRDVRVRAGQADGRSCCSWRNSTRR